MSNATRVLTSWKQAVLSGKGPCQGGTGCTVCNSRDKDTVMKTVGRTGQAGELVPSRESANGDIINKLPEKRLANT
jgi:hypothetical protein